MFSQYICSLERKTARKSELSDKTGVFFSCWYNPFLVYCRELAPSTVSLTGDRAQGDDSKHDLHYNYLRPSNNYRQLILT